MKFMNIVCPAFLARQKPVSASANPACMNITRKPVMSTQMKLDASRFSFTLLARLTANGSVVFAVSYSCCVMSPGARPIRSEP